jgi:hypothetical protein
MLSHLHRLQGVNKRITLINKTYGNQVEQNRHVGGFINDVSTSTRTLCIILFPVSCVYHIENNPVEPLITDTAGEFKFCPL